MNHIRCRRLVFLLFFQPLFPIASESQTQVVLGSSKDNTLYESLAGALSNGAGQHFFAGKTNNSLIRRGLIAFDVAGNVSEGATIQSVTLRLSMSRADPGPQTVGLYRVSADWGEGTSVASGNEGGGAASTNDDATWLHTFFNVAFWTSAGGDFSATPSASLSVSDTGEYTWGSTPEMVSDVQQWLDNPPTNFGWVFVGNESATQTSKRFDTKENISADLRPRLTVTYTPAVGVVGEEDFPHKFSLHQNYPNPFNPSTTFSFDIPRLPQGTQEGGQAYSSFVILKVYNLLGQEVATLVNEVKQAGRYEVAWDGSGLPSGVYLYRLQTGSFVETKKLVLVR